MDVGVDYTSMGMYIMPQNCTFLNGQNGKFYVIYILPQ